VAEVIIFLLFYSPVSEYLCVLVIVCMICEAGWLVGWRGGTSEGL